MPTYYVNPASAGGTGTTSALSGATAAFASLSACAASRRIANEDMTGDGVETWSLATDGTADTTAVSIAFTTTDSDYINIVVEAGSRHAGVWDDTKYRLVLTSSADHLIEVSAGTKVMFNGLQLRSITPSGAAAGLLVGGTATIANCLIRGPGGITPAFYGITCSGTYTRTIYNTIVYNVSNHGSSHGLHNVAGTANVYNCTIIALGSAGYNVRNSGTMACYNVYAGGCSGYDYNGTITMTNCAASDTTASGTNPYDSVAINTTNFTNVTAGSEDYRLPLGSALIGAGTDNPGSGLYSDDIAGTTRS